MSILKEIKRLFGVKGASIEEALKNVDSIGGGSGVVLVKIVVDDSTETLSLNKTWAEINQLVEEDKVIAIKDDNAHSFQFVQSVYEVWDGGKNRYYEVSAFHSNDGVTASIQKWRAEYESDYPVRELD